MSRAAYDRARAAYIKSHSRAERLRRAWILAGVLSYHLGERCKSFFNLYPYYCSLLEEYGYDIKQVDALSESVNCGITSPTIRQYHRFCFDMLRAIARYQKGKDKELLAYNIAMYMEGKHVPQSNPAMVLRAAFLEAEHALIILPRTTLSKMETVADAPHSS